MSFHLSAQDIYLTENRFLRASLQREDGVYESAGFDLDSVLGNENGMIHWDGRGIVFFRSLVIT